MDKPYRAIGFCLSQIYLECREYIIQTLTRNAALNGIKLLIFNTFVFLDENPLDAERQMFDIVNYDVLDGFIICPDYIRNNDIIDRIVGKAKAHNVPILIIDGSIDGCHSLVFDFTTSFNEIVRHIFIDHGCTKVNFIAAYKGNAYSEARLDCYKRMLAEKGLPFEEDRVFYGDFEEKYTYTLIDEMLAKGELPEAIICANDDMALAACDALFKKEIIVPKDVIVTGFDGCPQERYHTPRLTTCAPNWDDVGKEIMQRFKEIWAGGNPTDDIVIAYKMRIAQSCGCAPLVITDANYMCFDNAMLKKEKTNFNGRIFEVSHKISANSSYSELFNELEPIMDMINCTSFRCCLKESYVSEQPLSKATYEETEYKQGDGELNYSMVFHFEDGERMPTANYTLDELLPSIDDVLADPKRGHLFFFPVCRSGAYNGYTVMEFDMTAVDFGNIFNYMTALNANLGFIKSGHDMKRTLELLEYMHVHDALTNIYNRRGFYSNVGKMLAPKRMGLYITVFSIDMDDMKYINDNFGHHEGDNAIKATAQAMVRASEPYLAVNARFGGDEFLTVILTPDAERVSTEFPERMASCINEFNRTSGKDYLVQVSIGCSYRLVSQPDICVDEVIREADASMYTDKQSKKSSRVRSRT